LSESGGNSAVAELRDITRVYQMGTNEVRALDGFSFRFERGEYWSIMGSSGSGKSTLLNILGCIDRPSSGSYQVRGTEVSDLSDDQLSELRGSELGFVFQSYNLIPQLNVIENILVPVLYRTILRRTRKSAPGSWPSALASTGALNIARRNCRAVSSSASRSRAP